MKSEAMLFARNAIDLLDRPILTINNNPIAYVQTTKNLGLIFSENLSWEKHVNSICGRVFSTLSTLSNSSMFIPQWLRRQLVVSLIIPILSYGDVIFSTSCSAYMRKLDICFNACLRFIHKRKKFDHLSDVRDSILGCELKTFYKYRICAQIFKILSEKAPSYLYDKIEFARSTRTMNIAYDIPRTNILLESFSVRSAQHWNNLPNWVKLSANIHEFKKLLKSHLNFSNV